MNYGDTGREGVWPHFQAVATFLRHRRRDAPPSIGDVALHEAGHVVTAHAVGLPPGYVTARPSSEGRGHHRFDRERAPKFAPEARLVTAFGGRAADERNGRFGLVRLDTSSSDEWTAFAHAATLAEGNDERMVQILRDRLADAREILSSRWSDVLRIAVELEHRDLSGTELDEMLGPPAAPRWEANCGWSETHLDANFEVLYIAASNLIALLPYGLAFLPSPDGDGRHVMWLGADATHADRWDWGQP